jgi:hypothetical protein
MSLTYPDMVRAPPLQDAWQQRVAEPEGCCREGRGNGDIHVGVIPSPVALCKKRDRLLSTVTVCCCGFCQHWRLPYLRLRQQVVLLDCLLAEQHGQELGVRDVLHHRRYDVSCLLQFTTLPT